MNNEKGVSNTERACENDHPVSINALTEPLLEALIADAGVLRLGIERLANGTVVVDAGIKAVGGIEAGRRIAEICLGGLGRVRLRAGGFANWPWQLEVSTSTPVIACLASQYAGWSLKHGDGKDAFQALGSGPARALGSKEELYRELGYRDRAQSGCLVLEVAAAPPVALADHIAKSCDIAPERLTLILTPTTSLAGSVQVVARSLEVALHKAHTLHFPLATIVDGMASAPVCPPAPQALTAMGRTNDAILFGGQAQLFVDCGDHEAAELAERMPSSCSRDYGKPFAQIFKDYNYNFYDIDPMLFSPALVTVTCLKSGRSYHAGRLDEHLLESSFGEPKSA